MTLLQRPARLAAGHDTLRARAWVWLRAGAQLATLLLVAWQLGAHDFGRYVAAFAIASVIAPLFVAGPAYVYLDSHAAFGCTRDQLATVWRRMLLVFGVAACLFVPLGAWAFAGDWANAGLWLAVGFTEIVLAGFIEMTARHRQDEARDDAMGMWLALPSLARLAAVLGLLAAGVDLALAHWVLIAFATSLILAWSGARSVPRRDNPRAFDTLTRLLRTGFRFANGNVAHHLIADGDKPFISRIAHAAAAGPIFIAQRVADLFCLPLQTAIARALPRLLESVPGERAPLWRHAWGLPAAYAVFAGGAMFAIAPQLERLGADYGIAAAALRWLCWLPLLVFARGMLGNAAVVAGRHDACARGLWFGALARVAGAIGLVSLLGWEGAILSLLIAEAVPIVYLAIAMRRTRAVP